MRYLCEAHSFQLVAWACRGCRAPCIRGRGMGPVCGVVGGTWGPFICGPGGWHALRPAFPVPTHAQGTVSQCQTSLGCHVAVVCLCRNRDLSWDIQTFEQDQLKCEILMQVCLAAEKCGNLDFDVRNDMWNSSEGLYCNTSLPKVITFWDILRKVLPPLGKSLCYRKQLTCLPFLAAHHSSMSTTVGYWLFPR